MPEALDLAPLAAMAVITFAILVLMAYKATVGQLVDFSISFLSGLSFKIPVVGFHLEPFSPVVDALQALQNAVYHYLGTLIQADKAIWNAFVHWNAYAWSELSGAVGDVAEGAEQALHSLRHAVIPAVVSASTAPLIADIRYAEKLAQEAISRPAEVVHKVEKLVAAKPLPKPAPIIEKIYKVAKAGALDIPKAIANPWPRIHGIDDTLKDALRRANESLRKLTPAGILGLTLAAVGKLGFDWIRCSNLRKYGPKLCGVKPSILEDLLLGLTAIFGTLSLVSLAEQMQGLVGELSGEIQHFWRVDVAKASAQRQLGQTGL